MTAGRREANTKGVLKVFYAKIPDNYQQIFRKFQDSIFKILSDLKLVHQPDLLENYLHHNIQKDSNGGTNLISSTNRDDPIESQEKQILFPNNTEFANSHRDYKKLSFKILGAISTSVNQVIKAKTYQIYRIKAFIEQKRMHQITDFKVVRIKSFRPCMTRLNFSNRSPEGPLANSIGSRRNSNAKTSPGIGSGISMRKMSRRQNSVMIPEKYDLQMSRQKT